MSFSARSLSVSSVNSTVTLAAESPAFEVMCRTPVTLAMASSIGLTTWLVSSDGAAPGWPTLTEMIGRSMFGIAVTGRFRKL